jgi:hypothetical protein
MHCPVAGRANFPRIFGLNVKSVWPSYQPCRYDGPDVVGGLSRRLALEMAFQSGTKCGGVVLAYNRQKIRVPQLCKEVITFVVNYDKCGEVFDLYFPHGLHA